jgi:hypothetical protein
MRLIIVFLAMTLLSLDLKAQETMPYQPRFEINFAMGFPTAGYAESTHDIGIGLDAGFYFPIKSLPWLQLGPQFFYLSTGRNEQIIDQQLEITLGDQVIDRIDIPMRVETANSIIGGHLVVRVEGGSTEGILKPYLQGMVGVRRIATDISIYDESDRGWFTDDDDDDKITSSTALEDWVFSFGAGAGLCIRLGSRAFLNLGANYLVGGKADYYTDDDIDNFEINFSGDGSNYDPNDPMIDDDDININSDPTNSETSIIQINLGLSFIIGE